MTGCVRAARLSASNSWSPSFTTPAPETLESDSRDRGTVQIGREAIAVENDIDRAAGTRRPVAARGRGAAGRCCAKQQAALPGERDNQADGPVRNSPPSVGACSGNSLVRSGRACWLFGAFPLGHIHFILTCGFVSDTAKV